MTVKNIFTCALALISTCCASAKLQTQIPDTCQLSVADSLIAAWPDSLIYLPDTISGVAFLPATFVDYKPEIGQKARSLEPEDSTTPQWLVRALRTARLERSMRQHHSILHPDAVPYNLHTLPAPPEEYVLVADPERAIMVFERVIPTEVTPAVSIESVELKPQNWLNKFDAMLQFSQGYVSPNWYQGGNNSLNLVSDFNYDTQLNTKFHPNLLFENHFQWRTTLAATQDDPYRKYSLTENRFQINSKFGYKAIHNWYYTFTGVFKTPVFNGYKIGTDERTASFLSPGELNIGLGMTYNFTNKKETFSLGVTISPLSYNLKTVIDRKVDEIAHGLEEGHRTKHSYGSSTEIKWSWQICYNVKWESRIFAFTNYEYFQGDWQNQFAFTINRFLSANLNVDLRYDSSVPPMGSWKRWQLRELLSLGFSYTINH